MFASVEEAVSFVHARGLTATLDDAKVFMEYLRTLPVLEQLLVLKLAKLNNYSPFLGKIVNHASVEFKGLMSTLAEALTKPENERSDEEKAIYALVKDAD